MSDFTISRIRGEQANGCGTQSDGHNPCRFRGRTCETAAEESPEDDDAMDGSGQSSVVEAAQILKCSPDKATRIFEDETGVVDLGSPETMRV